MRPSWIVNQPAALILCIFSVQPAWAQQRPPEDTKIDVLGGGLTVASGINSLSIGARFQGRFTVDRREEFDGDTAGTGVGRADAPFSQFDVPRMRVSLSGGAFRPWMRYLFQFDFSRTAGDGASKIKDAVVEIRPTGTPFRIVLGQFKVPFSMQQMTSSGRQQFVDRAITDAKFAPARDMGATFGGSLAGRRVGYEVGVFNGSGESVRHTNASHILVGRAFFNPFGAYALSEGSSDATASSVLHLGVSARSGAQMRGRTAAGVIDDADNQSAYDLEFAFKGPRFYSTAEHFWMIDEQRNPVVGPEIKSRGYHAQAAFMVVPAIVELGARVARIDGDTSIDDATVSEWLGVFGYYWRAHNFKLQTDFGKVGYGPNFTRLSPRARAGLPGIGTRLVSGRSLSDLQLRVQLQVAY